VVQDDVRRLLAYSGVAHAGFILTGVVAGRAGTGGVWFYLAVYAVQLVGAYAVVAAVSGPSSAGSAMARYAGLGRRQPFLALGLTVLLLGMAGIPLTSGFIAKFGVFQEAWRAGFGWLVVVALLASVVSFFIYLRVIVAMYMGEADEDLALASKLPSVVGSASDGIAANHRGVGLGTPLRAVLTVAIAVTLIFGLLPAPLLRLAADALPL
jgi:NADH-quinone oxidoreductase subunit N